MKFNNPVAKREYKKLVKYMNYEDKQTLSGIIKEAEEKLKDEMLSNPQKLHEQAVTFSYYEADYSIVLICWICDSCELVHVEVAECKQFILN